MSRSYGRSDLPSDVEEDGHFPTTANNANVADCIPSSYNSRHQLCTSANRPTFHTLAGNVGSIFSRPLSQDVPPPSNDPYDGYKSEAKRLETFHDWPTNAVIPKEEFAKDGFIYMHSQDRVQCVFCRSVLRDWEDGDIVSEEHRKFSPECGFAAGYDVGNKPIPRPLPVRSTPQTQNFWVNSDANSYPANMTQFPGNGTSLNIYGGNVKIGAGGITVTGGEVTQPTGGASTHPQQMNRADAQGSLPSLGSNGSAQTNVLDVGRPKYSNWESKETRLRSFAEWPADMRPTPSQLVEAGLLYMGSGAGDRCKCYWCGGELYDWEPMDDPMEEHAKWFPDCGFVRSVKGEGYIQYVKDKQIGLVDTPPPVDFFSSPHVLAVLQSGYSREQIQFVISKYGPEKLVEARSIIMAIEQEKNQQNVQTVYQPTDAGEDVAMADVEQQTLVKTSSWNQSGSGQSGFQPGKFDGNQAGAPHAGLLIGRWDGNQLKDKSQEEPQQKVKTTGENGESSEKETPAIKTSITNKPEEKTSSVDDTKDPKDVKKILEENEKLKDQRLCKICLDNELCITFIPCGHLATCAECSTSVKECPICRKKITGTVKTFWS